MHHSGICGAGNNLTGNFLKLFEVAIQNSQFIFIFIVRAKKKYDKEVSFIVSEGNVPEIIIQLCSLYSLYSCVFHGNRCS